MARCPVQVQVLARGVRPACLSSRGVRLQLSAPHFSSWIRSEALRIGPFNGALARRLAGRAAVGKCGSATKATPSTCPVDQPIHALPRSSGPPTGPGRGRPGLYHRPGGRTSGDGVGRGQRIIASATSELRQHLPHAAQRSTRTAQRKPGCGETTYDPPKRGDSCRDVAFGYQGTSCGSE